MHPSLLGGLAIVTTLLCAGCGLLSSAQEDESIGWSAQRLYGEAKDAMNAKEWQKAIKFLEKLEARYPYGRFAQQAQLEVAYAQYKDNERALAIATANRFIKLNPNRPISAYALYPLRFRNTNELKEN